MRLADPLVGPRLRKGPNRMATLVRALAGSAALALAGCQAYHPYGYGYGGTYTVPQGSYVPQGAMIGPGPQAQLQPMPYTDTPTLGTKSATSRPLPDSLKPEELVPGPRERSAPGQTGLTEPGADEIPKAGVDPAGSRPQAPGLRNFTDDSGDHSAQLGEDEEIPEPGRLQHAGAERPVGLGAALTEDDPSPFGYDNERYTWLQGLAEFDEQEGIWRIQYDPSEFADQYSGRLTLAKDDRLDSLLHKDVVRLRGRIDMDQRDVNQKPVYVIESAQKLRPKRR